jgi:p-cumate 2,3-dioxygenase beta subunit
MARPDRVLIRKIEETTMQGRADRELRAEIESFLFEEAELLDAWRLDEWVGLFTEDATNHVPALDDPDRDPAQSVFLVADDLARIRSRVRQLTGDSAWAENPRSQTRRFITNVRVTADDGATVCATANFLVHRCRMERTSTFAGQYRYKLVRCDGGFKIAERTAVLAQDTLRQQGIMSIIV